MVENVGRNAFHSNRRVGRCPKVKFSNYVGSAEYFHSWITSFSFAEGSRRIVVLLMRSYTE